jgi:hypothetical protein
MDVDASFIMHLLSQHELFIYINLVLQHMMKIKQNCVAIIIYITTTFSYGNSYDNRSNRYAISCNYKKGDGGNRETYL